MIEHCDTEALALGVVDTRADVHALAAVRDARTHQQRAVLYDKASPVEYTLASSTQDK